MRIIRTLSIAAAVTVLPLSGAYASSITVNGGFEVPNVPAGTFGVFAASR